MCLLAPSYPDEVFVKLQSRQASVVMSPDFWAKTAWFLFSCGVRQGLIEHTTLLI